MKPRTIKQVKTELRRTLKARKTLQKDLKSILDQIGEHGGMGSPDDPKVKCSPLLRLLRETKKSLDILLKIEKESNVELLNLEQAVREQATDAAYSL